MSQKKDCGSVKFFFFHPPSSGITPCVGPTEVVLDLTLDAALLFVVNREEVTTSSRVGTDLMLTSIKTSFGFTSNLDHLITLFFCISSGIAYWAGTFQNNS